MDFPKEFLNGLYVKLEEYCVENGFKIKDWLEYQGLACVGGYQVFKDYCMGNNKEVLLLQVELMRWDEFDDFIYKLSKKLIENEEESHSNQTNNQIRNKFPRYHRNGYD